ncbi:unnamed protein product [Ectocarpus sp. 12 AP-2014]
MDLFSKIVGSNLGNNLLQTGVAVASGKSAKDAAKTMVTRAQSRRLEKFFMGAADAYSSGYSTLNTFSLKKFGVSGLTALAVWITIVVVQKNRAKAEAEQEDSAVAGTAALFAAFLSVAVIDVVRRQTTFSKFTGTNMFMQYVWFFSVPFALSATGAKVASPLNFKQSGMAGLVVAVATVLAAKRLYFVFKQNDLEREVFSQIANVLDACQGAGEAGCNHEHAGYMEAFSNMVKPYIDQVNYVLPDPLKAADVARDVASRQIFDTLRHQV